MDLLTQRPEVNLIYSEASNLTVGTMAGLSQLGRGTFEDGKPLTEIVASVDFDSVEFEQVYDPDSSLKVSMGLPPIETAQGRIDLIMDVASGTVAQRSDPAEEKFYKAYTDLLLDDAAGRSPAVAGRPVRRRDASRLAGTPRVSGRDRRPDDQAHRSDVRAGVDMPLPPHGRRHDTVLSRHDRGRGDVASVAENVEGLTSQEPALALSVHGLTRDFSGVRAVDHVTFAIDAKHRPLPRRRERGRQVDAGQDADGRAATDERGR